MSTYFDQVAHEVVMVILSYTEKTYPLICFKDILTYYSNQKYGKICIEIHTTLREPTEDSVDMENFNYTLVYHDFDNNFRNTPISYKDALNIMTHVKYYSTKYHGINT